MINPKYLTFLKVGENMELKKIHKKEIKEFTGLDKDKVQLEKTIKNLLREGLSYSNWCFIIEQKGNIIGRA
jgi:hypothetical protein